MFFISLRRKKSHGRLFEVLKSTYYTINSPMYSNSMTFAVTANSASVNQLLENSTCQQGCYDTFQWSVVRHNRS